MSCQFSFVMPPLLKINHNTKNTATNLKKQQEQLNKLNLEDKLLTTNNKSHELLYFSSTDIQSTEYRNVPVVYKV